FGALLVEGAVKSGQRIEAERQGKILVDGWFAARIREAETQAATSPSRSEAIDASLRPYYRAQASRIAKDTGGDAEAVAQRLRYVVRYRGTADFIEAGVSVLPRFGVLPAMLGSMALLGWSL